MPAMEAILRLVVLGDSRGGQKALRDLGYAAQASDAQVGAASQRLGAMGEKISGAGRSMTMGLTLPLAAMGGLAVHTAATFETSMNQVQAATGATEQEFEELSAYAKKMGADTVFSAAEAAEAMLELAKSGMTPLQIKAGGLKATMDLAAAGELALADAAIVVSNAMNTFSLETEDAASVAAALAGGANASSADVSDLAQALAQVGPGAKTAHMSLQETVAVLAEFADKGIRGSDAGTSLKAMLMRLVPTTDKAAGMMERLGINFINADGSMKSISEIAEILQEQMGGLSDAEKTFALNVMFGSDATRAATILMEGGAESLEKYTKATNDQAAATNMAEARMKGMGGTLEQMKGSIETAGISFGEVMAPGINAAAKGLTWLANTVGGLPKPLKAIIVTVGLFAASLGPLLMLTGKLLTSLAAIQKFRMAGGLRGVLGDFRTTGGMRGMLTGGKASTGAGGTSAAAEQRNTVAVNQNTAAQQRATAATNRSVTASNRETVADNRSAAASNLETAADRRSAAASGLAGTRIGGLGGKAKTAAPAIGQVGVASGKAKGSILGMNAGAVKGAAALGGLAVAVTFTMNQLSKLGNAIDQMDAAAKQADKAKDQALANAEAQLARIKKKYGEDSPQYRKMLQVIEQIRKQIARDAYNKPWWASASSKAKSGISSAWNWAFGGGQASGGDYMVTRPTLFLAGEAGPERATFTPRGKQSPGGTVIHLGGIHIAAVHGTDGRSAEKLASQVADLVASKLARRQLAVAGTGF